MENVTLCIKSATHFSISNYITFFFCWSASIRSSFKYVSPWLAHPLYQTSSSCTAEEQAHSKRSHHLRAPECFPRYWTKWNATSQIVPTVFSRKKVIPHLSLNILNCLASRCVLWKVLLKYCSINHRISVFFLEVCEFLINVTIFCPILFSVTFSFLSLSLTGTHACSCFYFFSVTWWKQAVQLYLQSLHLCVLL